jgi:hypothetical protein
MTSNLEAEIIGQEVVRLRLGAPASRKRFDAHFGAVDNRAVDAVAVIRHWHVVPVAVDRALERRMRLRMESRTTEQLRKSAQNVHFGHLSG